MWRILHDILTRHGYQAQKSWRFINCHSPAQNTVTFKKIHHEKQTKSLKPNFNSLLSPIALPILPWYMNMWLNKKSDWEKLKFGVKPILP